MTNLKLCLPTNAQNEFLKLFRPVLEIKSGDKTPNINVFVLKSRNGEFIYSDLADSIAENLTSYAMSRKQLKKNKKYDSKNYRLSVKRLMDNKSNEGEFGEIALFSFLESHLKAPKIATKLELKTTSNEYVKGSDGIHLLKIKDDEYQIIFGESKTLSSTIKGSISKAVQSIINFKNRKKNNINDEITLVQIHIDREFDKKEADIIKSLLLPTETPKHISVEHAFGIFIGHNIKIPAEIKNKNQKEFEKYIDNKILTDFEDIDKYLKETISEKKLENYKLYVYILPIEEIETKRKELLPNGTN